MKQDIKYQIFISSTYEDLKEEREEAIKTVLKLYHFPIGMEMFSAGDEEQWKVIKDTIDSSDYYIVIIGHRYGSETKDGISYTEKEYNYATKQGIPVLAFIKDRNAATRPHERDDDSKKQEKLRRFIDKVQSKMRDSWKNKDELGKNISIALKKIIDSSPQIGWVRNRETLLNNKKKQESKTQNINIPDSIILTKAWSALYRKESIYLEAIRLFGADDEYCTENFVQIDYKHLPLKLSSELKNIKTREVKKKKKEAINKGAPFWDGPNTRLLYWRASPRSGSAKEVKHLELILGPVGWYCIALYKLDTTKWENPAIIFKPKTLKKAGV